MKRLLLLAVLLFPMFSNTVLAQQPTSPPLYAVNPYSDSLMMYSLDAPDTTGISIQLPSAQLVDTAAGASTVTGCNGLAVHPCTGEIYIMYKNALSGRSLGIVDVSTGIITNIGNTGENIAGITFVNDTILVGVSGDGGNSSETLYLIDMNTAAITLITPLGSGSDGETIAFCPDNGAVYHWSGRDTNPAMDRIDLVPIPTVTPVTRTGYNYDEVFGATYVGGGNFLLSNLDQEFILVDTAGFATLITTPTYEYNKGLAFPSRYVWFSAANSDSLCPYGSSGTTLVASEGADAYQWYMDGAMIAGETNDTLTATSPGIYKCEITRGLCTAFSDDSLTISAFTVDAATIYNTPDSICAGEDAIFFGNESNVGTQEWWTLDGSTQLTSDSTLLVVAPAVSDTFLYHVYSANGCYDQDTAFLTVNPLPTVVANGNAPYCEGTDVVLTGSGADSYTWDNSVVDGVGFTQAVGTTVSYIVTGTDVNGCMNADTIDVTVNPNPVVTLTSTDEMLGNDGTVDLTVVAGAGLTFDWDNDGTGDFDDTEDLSGLAAGTYTVVAMAPTGCTTTETITVDSQVGLEEFGAGAELSIYPNPNDGVFSIELINMNAENISVKIINAAGQVVVSSEFDSNVLPVNIQEFGAGVYNIVITDGVHNATQQIIVK